MVESERAQRIKRMMRKHLEEFGAANWKGVRLQCPDISDATFWRYVKISRENQDGAAGPGGPAEQSAVQATGEEVPNLGALPSFYDPYQKARWSSTSDPKRTSVAIADPSSGPGHIRASLFER